MQWEKQRSFEANKQLFGLGRTTLEPCRAVWDQAGKEFFYCTQDTAVLGCVEPFSLIFLPDLPCLGLSALLCCGGGGDLSADTVIFREDAFGTRREAQWLHTSWSSPR